jgi:succinate dehydrogenase hydrophobic anchor subunit
MMTGATRAWVWTVRTGVLLLVLVTAHMIANHFVVQEVGGLRTYRQVLDYVSHPAILVVESLFLVTVTVHSMLGIHRVVLDLGPSARTLRRVEAGLWVLGAATIGYGGFLLATLASRA